MAAPVPADIVVRDALPADARIIAEFNIRLAVETEGLHLDSATIRRGVDHVLADPAKGRYFVAEAMVPASAGQGAAVPGTGREVVGCTMLTYEFSDWRDANIWWIQSVYVRAEWRRRGVFRALYEHIRTAALAADVAALRLYVEKQNLPAQKTYGSLGMEFMPYLVMTRRLAALPTAANE